MSELVVIDEDGDETYIGNLTNITFEKDTDRSGQVITHREVTVTVNGFEQVE